MNGLPWRCSWSTAGVWLVHTGGALAPIVVPEDKGDVARLLASAKELHTQLASLVTLVRSANLPDEDEVLASALDDAESLIEELAA